MNRVTESKRLRMICALAWIGAAICSFIIAPQAADAPRGGLLLRLSTQVPASVTLDGDAVAAWKSYSTPEPIEFRAAGDQRPRWVLRDGLPPAIRLDGVDDALLAMMPGLKTETLTLAVLLTPRSNRGGEGGVVSSRSAGGHDYDSGLAVDLRYSSGAFEELNIEGVGRIGATMDLLQRAYPFGQPRLLVVERDDHDVRLHVDGLREGARAVAPAAAAFDEVRIGSRFYGGSERGYLDADVFEVALYDRILAPDELAALTLALMPSADRVARESRAALLERDERLRNRMTQPVTIDGGPSAEGLWATPYAPNAPLAELPIRRDLREALELCVHSLNSLFDRDRDDEPFFYANCRADGTGEMHHSVNIGIPHVVGRALIGSMAAEQAARVQFPEEGLGIYERYLRRSFDNEDHLNSYYDPAREGRRFIEFHNIREGLYGLYSLAWGRGSEWALREGELMLQCLRTVTDPETGRWSVERLEALSMAGRCEGVGVPNSARVVDPLMAWHRLTGSTLALELAAGYARSGLEELFLDDGTFAPMERSSGHIHSITSSLSGIIDYAAFVGDEAMLERCRQVMDHGVPEYFSSWGWGDEVMPEHPADVPLRGEINQTGDVVRAALLLGDAGYTEYYDLAERFTRSMILPTQHRDPELRRFLRTVAAPASDAERDVLERSVGGFSMQLPHDRMREGDWPVTTLDIASGAAHALSEVYRRRCVVNGSAARVIMLFDSEGDGIRIRSGLPTKGEIEFTADRAIELSIRVPGWVDQSTLTVRVNGQPREAHIVGAFARIGDLAAGDRGAMTFAVPWRIERETVDSVEFTTTWIGGQIIAIEPRGKVSPLPF